MVLEYHRTAGSRTQRQGIRIGFAVGALVAAVCSWVSFAQSLSPWDVVQDYLFGTSVIFHSDVAVLLAAPAFLALPIGLWKVRLAISPSSKAWERMIL